MHIRVRRAASPTGTSFTLTQASDAKHLIRLHRPALNQEKRSMNNVIPFVFVFAALGAIFLYGYLTDPDRPRPIAIQPAHGEANLRLGMKLPRRR